MEYDEYRDPIVEGIIHDGTMFRIANRQVSRMRYTDEDSRIAILDERPAWETLNILEERGVEVLIFTDNHDIGLICCGSRLDRMDAPQIRRVVESVNEEKEWWTSPNGKYYVRAREAKGGAGPSRIDLQSLIRAVSKVL